MELWSPLPLYEGVFYRRLLIQSAAGGSSSSAKLLSDPGSNPQSFTYNNHVLQGCNLWYNPRDLKPRDIGRYRLVLVEGTNKGRMRGLQLSLDSELKSYTINSSSAMPLPFEGRKFCIEVTGISHTTQVEERWQIITTSEETQVTWMENLKKARSFLDIAEVSGESEKLRELTRKMREGLVVRKRISSFKLYNNTIVGFRAVRWIMQDKSCTLPQALAIGNRMLNLGYIYHVAFEHLFYSKSLLYQFATQFDPVLPLSNNPTDFDVEDLTAENHSLLSSFHVLQRPCLQQNALLINLQTHTATLQQSMHNLTAQTQTVQTYMRFIKMIMLVMLILISIIFVHVDFDHFSVPFFALLLIAMICILTIIFTPILVKNQVHDSQTVKSVILKIQKLLSDAVKQSQEVDSTIIHHRGRSNVHHTVNKHSGTKPIVVNVNVIPTINETTAYNDSNIENENDSIASDNDDDEEGDEEEEEGDDNESIDSSCSDSTSEQQQQQATPTTNKNTPLPQSATTNSSKTKEILLKYTNLETEWPNYPLLIRRSNDMLAKHLTSVERETLLQPLHLHKKELSVVDFENEYFIGKAYLNFNNLPDTNQDLFRGKKRQFQTVIQGKFKQIIPFTSLYIGQAYNEQPPQPPSSWLLNGIVKLIPSAQMRLVGNRPYLLSPLMATMQHVFISHPGDEPDIMNLDHEDDLSLLNDEFLLSCSSNSVKRKKYFSKRSNLAKYSTDPSVVYTFDFYAKQVNFRTFQLEVGIFKHDLIKALGWLPLQIMCVVYDPIEDKKKRSSSPHNEKEKNKDMEWNFLYNFEVWHQRSLATAAGGAVGGATLAPFTPPRNRPSLIGRVPEEKEWMTAFANDVHNSKDKEEEAVIKMSSPRKELGSLLLSPVDNNNDKDLGSNSGPNTPVYQHQQQHQSSSAGNEAVGSSSKLRSWLTRRGSKG